MHMDRRTLQAAVCSGDVDGWARPGPQRLRWYIYEDQLTATPPHSPTGTADLDVLRSEVASLRAEVAALREAGSNPATSLQAIRDELRAEARAASESAVADLRAHVVTLTETNLLLLEAQEELGGVAVTLDSVAQKYRRALGLFMTPGHPGELAEPPR